MDNAEEMQLKIKKLEKQVDELQQNLLGITNVLQNLNMAIEGNRITLGEVLKIINKNNGTNLSLN